jgi:serine/threonine protein kinase
LLDKIIGGNIGSGTFGSVFIVEKIYNDGNKKNGKKNEYYAMKKIDMKKTQNQNHENILKEINACGVCKHPNIVQYIDHYYDDKTQCVCLVLDLCEYGSLERVLKIFQREYPNKHISEEVLFQ